MICKAPDQWENNIIFDGKCLFGERAHIVISSVEKLILHEVSPAAFRKAGDAAKEICSLVHRGKLVTAENLADFLLAKEYRWGAGNGN